MIYIAVILAALLIAVVALSPRFAGRLYSRLVFAPIKAKPGDYTADTLAGIRGEDVFFRSGSRKLHGQFFENPAATTTILFSHSNWGNVDEWSRLVEALLRSGASVFAYDYRGFGLSEGVPSVSAVCKDALCAFDYLVDVRGKDPQKVVLFGSSLGSGVSCYLARKRKCGGLVLHGGFSSLRELSIDLMPVTRFVPALLYFSPSLNNCAALAKIDVPLLILHGRWDEVCAVATHPQRLLESSVSQSKELVVLPNSYHMDATSDRELFAGSLSRFISSIG